MKKQTLKNLIQSTLVLVFTLFAFYGCNEDNAIITDDLNALDVSSGFSQTEIDEISEGIDDIIENVFFDFESSSANKGIDDKSPEDAYLTDCVTITKEITFDSKTITVDFGEGCTTRNDNLLSGKIIMDINLNISDQSVEITNSFVDFYFNHKKIEGDVHKTRIKINENGNPQAIINKNIKIIWEDGSFVTVSGERKREWVEGFGSKIWGDNVFLVTGFWNITDKDGVVRIATIIEPLRRETACRFIVSGIVEIVKGDRSSTLNYGNGECDDLAIFTYNGIENEIHIKKFIP